MAYSPACKSVITGEIQTKLLSCRKRPGACVPTFWIKLCLPAGTNTALQTLPRSPMYEIYNFILKLIKDYHSVMHTGSTIKTVVDSLMNQNKENTFRFSPLNIKKIINSSLVLEIHGNIFWRTKIRFCRTRKMFSEGRARPCTKKYPPTEMVRIYD